MSGAAQRNEQDDVLVGMSLPATGTDGGAELRRIAAERLAAHRNRRAAVEAREAQLEEQVRVRRETARNEFRSGASRVRDAVAARYEQSVSYQEFLAAEAERATQQAKAEAEVAARKAQAVAEAQMKLLAEMEQWRAPEPGPREVPAPAKRSEPPRPEPHPEPRIEARAQAEPRYEASAEPTFAFDAPFDPPAAFESVTDLELTTTDRSSLRVPLIEELGAGLRVTEAAHVRPAKRTAAHHDHEEAEIELEQLDEELEFRHSAGFEHHLLEATPIPGNLIQFPRQLVAARKARPRLAEGPLREEAESGPQLRIFEVEAEQISLEPAPSEPAAAPDWQDVLLESAVLPQPTVPLTAQTHHAQPLHPATIERRLMAAAVDAACMGAAFVAFATIAVRLAGRALQATPLPRLGIFAACALLGIFLVYELLFFTFSDATPGMLYARIGLCTFADSNPTRKAMRRRVFATLLAASPVGLGLLWMWMDSERLGWHDRISRMYQREY